MLQQKVVEGVASSVLLFMLEVCQPLDIQLKSSKSTFFSVDKCKFGHII